MNISKGKLVLKSSFQYCAISLQARALYFYEVNHAFTTWHGSENTCMALDLHELPNMVHSKITKSKDYAKMRLLLQRNLKEVNSFARPFLKEWLSVQLGSSHSNQGPVARGKVSANHRNLYVSVVLSTVQWNDVTILNALETRKNPNPRWDWTHYPP